MEDAREGEGKGREGKSGGRGGGIGWTACTCLGGRTQRPSSPPRLASPRFASPRLGGKEGGRSSVERTPSAPSLRRTAFSAAPSVVGGEASGGKGRGGGRGGGGGLHQCSSFGRRPSGWASGAGAEAGVRCVERAGWDGMGEGERRGEGKRKEKPPDLPVVDDELIPRFEALPTGPVHGRTDGRMQQPAG